MKYIELQEKLYEHAGEHYGEMPDRINLSVGLWHEIEAELEGMIRRGGIKYGGLKEFMGIPVSILERKQDGMFTPDCSFEWRTPIGVKIEFIELGG